MEGYKYYTYIGNDDLFYKGNIIAQPENILYINRKIGDITNVNNIKYKVTNDIDFVNSIFNNNLLELLDLSGIPVNNVKVNDKVNHPSHYTWLKDKCGIEVIDIARHLNFNIGNVIKYVLRAGHKKEMGMTSKEKQIEDYKKAVFYLNDEIKRLQND